MNFFYYIDFGLIKTKIKINSHCQNFKFYSTTTCTVLHICVCVFSYLVYLKYSISFAFLNDPWGKRKMWWSIYPVISLAKALDYILYTLIINTVQQIYMQYIQLHSIHTVYPNSTVYKGNIRTVQYECMYIHSHSKFTLIVQYNTRALICVQHTLFSKMNISKKMRYLITVNYYSL